MQTELSIKMGQVYITDTYLTDIANAIRSKNGGTNTTYYPSEMASAINNIQVGFNCNIVSNFETSYQSARIWLEKSIIKDSNDIYVLNSAVTLNIMPTAKTNFTIDIPIVTVDNVTLTASSHQFSTTNNPIYVYTITNYAGKAITISGDGSGGQAPPVSFTINNIQLSGQNFNGLAYDGSTSISGGYQQYKYGTFIFKNSQVNIGNIGVWNGSETVEPSCCLYIGSANNVEWAASSTNGLYSNWEALLTQEGIEDLVIGEIHTLRLEQNNFYDETLTTDENYWKMCKALHDSSFNNSSASGYYILS